MIIILIVLFCVYYNLMYNFLRQFEANKILYTNKKCINKKSNITENFDINQESTCRTIINDKNDKIDKFVFIMVRHIDSELTNKYWIESYHCIRKFYPDIKIIIIDDNSNNEYLNDNNNEFSNIEIVKSEYPKRGELLPYYYFYKNKYAENAVIIHDSVFIKKKIDFENLNDNIKFLWHHEHAWDDIENEKRLITKLNNSDELLTLYNNKKKWKICVGVMSYINHNILEEIENKYKLFNLLEYIICRCDRMALERIFGLVCTAIKPDLNDNPSIFGKQNRSGYTYNNYKYDKDNNRYMPDFTKIWTGR